MTIYRSIQNKESRDVHGSDLTVDKQPWEMSVKGKQHNLVTTWLCYTAVEKWQSREKANLPQHHQIMSLVTYQTDG